jgi:hypothetical protein
MIKIETFGNWSLDRFIDNTMGAVHYTVYPKRTVTISYSTDP